MNEEKARVLRDRAEHLVAIKNFASFPVLREIVEDRIDRQVRQFTSTPDLPYQRIDYGRGVIEGMKWVLRVVELGEAELRKSIAAAQQMEANV